MVRKEPVIDAHHHFWDPAVAAYPWMTAEFAAIRRRFGPQDLAPLLAQHGVDRTVLVQTLSSLPETRELLRVAAGAGFVAGVVGWVDLADPRVGSVLGELRAAPEGRWLVGIRHQVHDEADPEWLAREDVRRGLRAVSDAGLAYDFLVRTRELPAAWRVAREFPETRFVIDHLAKPPIRTGDRHAWAEAMAPFSDLRNVFCKLSATDWSVPLRDWDTYMGGARG
ncbi:MAG TPA: amidohydrolase family protein [bacterium]|nr:amidohydrolase family protein [bacterium]